MYKVQRTMYNEMLNAKCKMQNVTEYRNFSLRAPYVA
jgi:hypothetical protein